MRKARQNGFERLESYLVRLIQEKGADLDQPGGIVLLLRLLKVFSFVFGGIVAFRYLLYRTGVLRRYPLGIQVISIGNVTAGGTGKTPVTEIFARTLAAEGRKVAILGDMLELGSDSDRYHQQIGQYAAGTATELIICVGPNSLKMYTGAKMISDNEVEYFADLKEAAAALPDLLIPGDTILLKASNSMHFSQLLEIIQKI